MHLDMPASAARVLRWEALGRKTKSMGHEGTGAAGGKGERVAAIPPAVRQETFQRSPCHLPDSAGLPDGGGSGGGHGEPLTPAYPSHAPRVCLGSTPRWGVGVWGTPQFFRISAYTTDSDLLILSLE